MTATMPTVPTPDVDKLTDLFFNCSVAVFVTDDTGLVLVENKAARALTGQRNAGRRLQERIGTTDSWKTITAALAGARLVEDQPCFVRRGGELSVAATANVSSAPGWDQAEYFFWMLRPELSDTLPSEGAAVSTSRTDAGTWISSVNDQPGDQGSQVSDERLTEILQLFFHHAPAGIHLLADDGSVAYANAFDVNLVGREKDPDTFLGHHVRHVYQDQRVVEDFMGRWGEDAPIINFRANFVRADEGVQPVLIYSTAHAQSGALKNTRCIVFRDPRPDLPRAQVSNYDFQF